MTPVHRPPRQTDFARFPASTPIVIDNGASTFRIGWAGEAEPRLAFRNIVQRPRHRSSAGETVTVVGDADPALMKYFDCTRTSIRSPFDDDVVFQFEYMEYILDYGFDRLGATSEVDHPILMTECECNPSFSRARMSELLFETYGVPSVAFGIDDAFSYKYNQKLGNCGEDGLAISCEFGTCHVVPFLKGQPVLGACCRTNVGGSHITDFLRQLLSLKYPYHAASVSWDKAEELKKEHCYVAHDYMSELQIFKNNKEEAEEKTRYWQLPWVPPPKDEPPSEEELARKAAIKEKSGQRLRDMAAAKRSQKIEGLEKKLSELEYIMEQLDDSDEIEETAILSRTGYLSQQEVKSNILKVTQSLRKAKGESNGNEENADASGADKYPLVSVPDEMLTPEQLKEKKKQILLKTTTEGRIRAKQRRAEEAALREKQEEERRTENPELYFDELRARYLELSEKVDQRKRQKVNGNNNNSSGAVGRGERLNAARKERMRLLTTAAFDRGKGEDTFGMRDEDWLVYNKMSKENEEDNDGDDDESELARIASKIQEVDPTFVNQHEAAEPAADPHKVRPLTAEDFKIAIGTERFRCPEVLFQPGMIGVDQAGIDEMVSISLRRLAEDESVKERLCQSILVTGGSSLFPGMIPRLEAGIRQFRPYLAPLKLVRASDPILDAWRGAAAFAASREFARQTFTLEDYREHGENLFHRYNIVYTL
ncbi:actin-related protein 5 isoform X1 [Lolium perenne]|uniref:actin-related protein 5 isoform X1 n=1 Tax=Lolium perenne TaxID=4522 RepID=UPI0021F59206|nr:actin-related protein 5 isoform X1 [Lolium perenne]